MKNSTKKSIKASNGITLIALVITIIVLLILAGISISMLSGDNSILQKATDAKQTSERAEAKEQAQMDIMAYIANKTANHQDASLDDNKIKDILTDKSYVKEAGDTSFTTKKGEYVIPYSELYQTNNVTPSQPETPTDKLATLEAKIKDEDGDCMIDENENIIPIDKWNYRIIEGTDTCRLEGEEDDEGSTYSAYKGQFLEDGSLEYKIPVFIKENDKTYKVIELGSFALSDEDYLKSVSIPNSVQIIGLSAFFSCNNLGSITIPDSVTSIGTQAFADCSSLSDVTIGNKVANIDEWAFRSCTSLRSITIPSSVSSIYAVATYEAFNDCNNLTSIIINKPQDSITGAPWGAPTSTTITWKD